MKVTISSKKSDVAGHLGPLCIACGNTKRFWVHGTDGDRLEELRDLPDGEVRIMACGRCQSRRSIVVAHID
jgi:hypothetical protein